MNKNTKLAGGYTDNKGEWRPKDPISFAPIFIWPPKLKKFFIWLFNYLFTWNLIYLAIVFISYYFLQPPLQEMKTFKASWISTIFIRNMALVWIIYGGWHLYLYTLKKRGTKAKYCPRWQSTDGSTFLWNNQVYDNVFWACASAVPIWTAFEVITFWMYGNDKLPYLDFKEHPVYFVALFMLIPFWREFHFYLIHRLIHWKPLYNKIHYLHHYNINPGPWSGLAMHPVEHLLYFSVVLIHWIVPSHPLHFLFNSQHTALTPAPGHTGFEGKIFKHLTFGSYFHYLHHRLFECNYGETTIPLDKWFGIFEDGSQTQTEKMEAISKYQPYQVTKIIDESPEVKSFYLTSINNSKLKSYEAGQHLTFRFPIHKKELLTEKETKTNSKAKIILRSYTLSGFNENNHYRISVKKENRGLVSSALHNSLKVGDIIEAKGPKGQFTHQENKRKTNVFIAAGIGITPILSMLKSIDKTERIFLILAAKEEKLLCFQEEIHELEKIHPKIRIDVFFSKGSPTDIINEFPSWDFHDKRLDIDSLKELLPAEKNYNFYICGPEQMTTYLIHEIGLWKGKRSKIYTESFGIQNNKNFTTTDKEVQVHFIKSNKTVMWDNDYTNLLEFAESNGVSLEAGCMFGECGACSTKLESGDVIYNYNTAVKPAKGNCLPCSCHPTSDIRLNA